MEAFERFDERRAIIVEQAGAHVRRRHDLAEPERAEGLQNGDAVLGGRRAVVDAGNEMAVEVDVHGVALDLSHFRARSTPLARVSAPLAQ